MGHDDIIQILPVASPIFDRLFSRHGGHIGIVHPVVRVTAFGDADQFAELFDDILVRAVDPVTVRIVELGVHEIVVLDHIGRQVTAGSGNNRV